jgi:hypothetical protein
MGDNTSQGDAPHLVYPFELGAKVPYELLSPCPQLSSGLRCLLTEGYIEVVPFQSSYHFKQSCNNGHFVRHVKRAEVLLYFGIPDDQSGPQAVRDALSPSRRTDLNVIVRDKNTCVYCGRRAGEVGLDGKRVVISADHIIPKLLIDPDDIRRDRELLLFARETQLVASCQSHNSAKRACLLPLTEARDLFIRHVLRSETRGANLGAVSTFERLYRLAQRNECLQKKSRWAKT